MKNLPKRIINALAMAVGAILYAAGWICYNSTGALLRAGNWFSETSRRLMT